MTKISWAPPRRAYLDANLLLDAFVSSSPHHQRGKNFLARMWVSSWVGYCSILTISEVFFTCIRMDYEDKTKQKWNPKLLKSDPTVVTRHLSMAQKFWDAMKGLIASGCIIMVDATVQQVDEAMTVMHQDSLAPTDSLHVARAAENCNNGGRTVFVSADHDLERVTSYPLELINHRRARWN